MTLSIPTWGGLVGNQRTNPVGGISKPDDRQYISFLEKCFSLFICSTHASKYLVKLPEMFPFFHGFCYLRRHLPICLIMMKFLSIVPLRKESDNTPYETTPLALGISSGGQCPIDFYSLSNSFGFVTLACLNLSRSIAPLQSSGIFNKKGGCDG